MNKEEMIRKIIMETIKINSPVEIFSDTNLVEIGMDSISFISLVTEIEDQFNIEFPIDKLIIANASTISQLVQIVEELSC